jgi:hypothetical protein
MPSLQLADIQRLANVDDVSSFYMYIYKMLPCPKVSSCDGTVIQDNAIHYVNALKA